MRVAAVLLALLLAVLTSGCASARPRADVVPPRRDACLQVRTAKGQGTAFAASWMGRTGVMTAWHVVRAFPDAPATVTGNGFTLELRFVRVGETDIAWAPGPVPPTWRVLAIADPVIGESVDCWGFGGGLLQMRRGTITEVQPKDAAQADGRYLRLDCGVDEGMSGGPILNRSGAAVAMVALAYSRTIIVLDPATRGAAKITSRRLVAADLP